jgi:hypothetical protein
MFFVTNNDKALAVAADARAGALARQLAEEVPDAVEDARLRFRGPIVGRGWGRRRNVNRDCLRRRGVHMPAKFDGRAQPHFAYEQNGFGSGVGRRFGRIGVKTERRHENGIHGLSRGSGWWRQIFAFLALRWQRGGQGSNVSSRLGMQRWRGLGRLHAGARKIARTGGDISLERVNLASNEAYRAALWNDQALVGKLRFNAHRTARGEHAHFAILFEAHRHVAWSS